MLICRVTEGTLWSPRVPKSISATPAKSTWIGCSTAFPHVHTVWDALQELYQLYEADDLDQANEALGRFADVNTHRPDTPIAVPVRGPRTPDPDVRRTRIGSPAAVFATADRVKPASGSLTIPSTPSATFSFLADHSQT